MPAGRPIDMRSIQWIPSLKTSGARYTLKGMPLLNLSVSIISNHYLCERCTQSSWGNFGYAINALQFPISSSTGAPINELIKPDTRLSITAALATARTQEEERYRRMRGKPKGKSITFTA